jgi:hypothetical protein
MDTKVVIDIICIHCGSTIHIQKKKLQEQCKLVCPGCKHPLHILFNITNNPQTYSFLSVAQQSQMIEETSKKERQIDEETQKAMKDKTIYRKDKHKARSYEDGIPGEEDVEESNHNKKKQPKLRESLFLTRNKLFGLVAERYKLSEGKTIIGRDDYDEPSDISIKDDDTISRRSISIEVVADDYGFDYILKVLNASNPVRVNGKQIKQGEKTYLDLGDVITIGHTNLKFDNQ